MRMNISVLLFAAVTLSACGSETAKVGVREATAAEAPGALLVVRDSTVPAVMEASGIAEPFAQATVSTKLMGSVVEVLVREGDRVATGQTLARIDARDLDAKRRQVLAGISSAEAMQREASLMANRVRALYVDSAAPKAQLDAAEVALARAEAGVVAARAGEAELDAIAGYSTVRAPFAGIVTQRFVDAGAFAAPGAPLVTVQDDARLRLSASVSPAALRSGTVRRGTTLRALIEGVPTVARIEGVVPGAAGSLVTINAVVENSDRTLPAGGAVSLLIPQGTRSAIFVPERAIRREGDLTGVMVQRGSRATRWVKLGRSIDRNVEVLAGLAAGDTIIVPSTGSAK